MQTHQLIPLFLSSAGTTGAPAATTSPELPLKDAGSTFSMAQAVRWLDERNFAIGRWDGTLTIFHRGTSGVNAPIISAALVAPSLAGVEMISRVSPRLFVSSNDKESIIVWEAERGEFGENNIRIRTKLRYAPEIGPANDGTTTEADGIRYFVSGHATGMLLVWRVDDPCKFTLLHNLDLRSADPIPSPFPLVNIRGVERSKPGFVVTGSEDGDICLVDVKEGTVTARTRYNPDAQRGINDIDVCGDHLVAANCSVGSSDRNLWLYRVHDRGFDLLDAVNLKVDESMPQAFNFCADQAVIGERQYFFAATQEGVVWMGLVENERLKVLGNKEVSTRFGAALAYEPSSRLLAVAGDNLHLFEVQ
jgi:hypothetical protein